MASVYDVDKGALLRAVLDRHGVAFKDWYSGWQSVHCPNPMSHSHGDRNASARANVAEGYFTCLACGLAGDGFDLMKELEGLGAKETLAELELGSDVKRPTREETWITWR
jgi:hypothetical protein